MLKLAKAIKLEWLILGTGLIVVLLLLIFWERIDNLIGEWRYGHALWDELSNMAETS